MKAGRIASVIVVLVLAVMAGLGMFALTATSWFESLGDTGRIVVLTGLIAGAGFLVAFPVGLVFDRHQTRLGAHLRDLAKSETEPTSIAVPFWVRSLTDAFHCAVVESYNQRQESQAKVRDLEVLLRATDAERSQLEGVVEELRDAVIVTDSFDEIIISNRAAAEALGFEVDQANRQPITAVLNDEKLCQMVRDVREIANIGDRRIVEHEVVRGDRAVPYEISISCLENLKHEAGAVVTILHDLTREREVSQMKSDFVSKASHELRTPLASIRAYVEMLVDGEADNEEARCEFYSVIQNETERLGRLIDNMLNISRIEAGIVQIDRKPVDLNRVIIRAVDALEPQAKAKSMSLNVKAAPVDLTIEGDEDMMYQVVLNLVSNAIKYTPEKGRVTISADSDNLTRSVVVSVADTGLGIPPDSIPKLFDKFYRVENFKRIAKGTGLGLNLCKHIVETVHHGQIGIESKLGMGSKFWFSVPMRYAGLQAA